MSKCKLSLKVFQINGHASLHKLTAGRKLAATHLNVSNKCVVAQVLKVVVFINLIRPFKNDTGL